MSAPVTRLEELARALEAREKAARSAGAEAEDEALGEKLGVLADHLSRDRQDLTALIESLRRRRGDPNHDDEFTGHGDRNDPESDLGL